MSSLGGGASVSCSFWVAAGERCSQESSSTEESYRAVCLILTCSNIKHRIFSVCKAANNEYIAGFSNSISKAADGHSFFIHA